MEHEVIIRLTVFFGLFLFFAILERIAPKTTLGHPIKARWITHFAITFVNTMALRLLSLALPLLAAGAALDAGHLGWGLFNLLNWPLWVEFILTLLILDFMIWAQHWATHKIPLLWRLHQVHHADVDFDVSTAIRFHPVEIALSMVLKIGIVYALGPMAWAVVVFEILLNGTALFNHANIALPVWLDKVLRWVIVTPDMHRIHHSVQRAEHDSNYGFALSIWDRLFMTYRSEAQRPLHVGLKWQDDRPTRIGWSLWLPFMRK